MRRSIVLLALIMLVASLGSVANAAAGQPDLVDYKQCANGAPPSTATTCTDGWINGILQSGNSHFREDQVTPQRTVISVPASQASAGRTLVYTYQTRKGGATNGTHAYDSLTTWDTTVTGADRCQGLATCPTVPTNTFNIPADGVSVPPCSTGPGCAVTSLHDIPGVMTMYGGTITNIQYGAVIGGKTIQPHSAPNGSGDDYATLTVTYSVPAAVNGQPRLAELLFGGHLASSGGPNSWGAGLGAANINGGPYHIKLAGADGSSIGNRDNQISAGAIAPFATIGIAKTADSGTVSAGSQIGYTITVSNTGTGASGTVTVTDNLPGNPGLDWSMSPAVSGCTISGSLGSEVLSCTFSSIPAGGSIPIHVVSPTTAQSCGVISNSASATSGGSTSTVGPVTITVQCPNVTIAKTANSGTVTAGQQIGYTITVSNAGPGTATNVVVSDNLPGNPGLDWSMNPAVSGCTITGALGSEVLNCTFASIASGGSVTINVISPTTEASCGAIQNSATATPSNGQTSTVGPVTININCPANVGIAKTADSGTVTAGSQIGYTITVSNTGSGASGVVTVTDNLPGNPGLDWSMDPTVSGCTISGSLGSEVLSCTFSSIPAGGSILIHVVSPTTKASCGTIANSASVTTEGSTSSVGPINITVQCPSVSIAKTADSGTVDAGQQIGYTITVTNNGPGTATNVQVSDNLPGNSGLDWSMSPAVDGCAITGSLGSEVLSCTFASMTQGQTISIHVVSPTTSASCGTIQNSATVTVGNGTGSTVGPVQINVICLPVLTVSKVACPGTAVPGGLLTYTITFGNSGNAPASGAMLVDTIPAMTSVVDAGGGTVSGNTITWNLGTLAPGASGTKAFTVLVNAPSGSTLVNLVVLSATGVTPASYTLNTPVSSVGAITHGFAYGVDVDALGLSLINELAPASTVAPLSPAVDVNEVLVVPIPGVVTINLIRQTSNSVIDTQAQSTATSTVLGVNLLGGAITADVVKGVSQSVASAGLASANSTGSTFVNLTINGDTYADVAPNTTVDIKNPLDPKQTIARAVLYEQEKTSALSGGQFTASGSVNMIHVTLLKPFLTLPKGAEIIVAHAQSDATYPSGLACGAAISTVSGSAFAAFVEGSIGSPPVPIVTTQVGDAEITPLGGTDSDHITNVSIPGVLFEATADDKACGTLVPLASCPAASSPNGNGRSTIQGVNILDGTITADILNVGATSFATGTSAGTNFSSAFVNLTVGGSPIDVPVAPNTTIAIPEPDGSLILVILNEQIASTDGTNNAEGTVNAIHVWVLKDSGAIQLEVIVASAHGDAHHV